MERRRLQEDIQMDETGTGVRMKSERGRGGVVEDVTYRRIHMKDIAGQCVQVTLNCERTVALARRRQRCLS